MRLQGFIKRKLNFDGWSWLGCVRRFRYSFLGVLIVEICVIIVTCLHHPAGFNAIAAQSFF